MIIGYIGSKQAPYVMKKAQLKLDSKSKGSFESSHWLCLTING